MSYLTAFPEDDLSAVLGRVPKVAEADSRMRHEIRSNLPGRWYALVSVFIAGLLGLDARLDDDLRSTLDPELARTPAAAWSRASLDGAERAILTFAEKATLAQATMRSSDVDALRAAGLTDRQILAVASLVAYQNYALRAAQAFGVRAR